MSSNLISIHNLLHESVCNISSKTSSVLRQQERDLLRSFQIKLNELNGELEKEREKNRLGSIEWVIECKRLEEELCRTKETAHKLSEENKQFTAEIKTLKSNLNRLETDKTFLINELAQTKKLLNNSLYLMDSKEENIKSTVQRGKDVVPYHNIQYPLEQRVVLPMLKQINPLTQNTFQLHTARLPSRKNKERERVRTQSLSAGSPSPSPTPFPVPLSYEEQTSLSLSLINSNTQTAIDPSVSAPASSVDRELRYKSLIKKLHKQLNESNDKYNTMINNLQQEDNNLKQLLKQCINDVIQTAQQNRKNTGNSAGSHIPVSFSQLQFPLNVTDRIAIVEWLLSQDKIIQILHSIVFDKQITGNSQLHTKTNENSINIHNNKKNYENKDNSSKNNNYTEYRNASSKHTTQQRIEERERTMRSLALSKQTANSSNNNNSNNSNNTNKLIALSNDPIELDIFHIPVGVKTQ